jgi:Tol biopolymer transport system component
MGTRGTLCRGLPAIVVLMLLVLLAVPALVACGGGNTTTATGTPSPSTSAALVPSSGMPTPLPAPTVPGTIAFGHDQSNGIALISTDGSGLKVLAKGGDVGLDQPAWSPDGRRIAFTEESSPKPSIWIMSADGSGRKRLATASAVSFSPTWSPDGARLAFVRRDPRTGHERLVISSADGSGLRSLGAASSLGGYDAPPAWASDGKLYGIRRDDLYRVDPGGGRPARVTRSRDVGAFAVSPDATKLAIYNFQEERIELRPNGGAGDPLVLVDQLPTYDIDDPNVTLTWSPDGRAIAFSRSTENMGPAALYIVNADGSGLSKVPNTDYLVWTAAWRPE